ncbi:MAG: SUMF1/EgtB/PvdO family nonheme iron enzyme [Acidobacteria bacterium]|nr:SUMF1/EgtB/PvdO family nonheme iron enzyme [Acidobacteriota bacterium]
MVKYSFVTLCIACFLFAPWRFSQAQRGQGTGQPNRPPNGQLVAGQYHALLIGVADYADPRVNDLDYPLRDAERVKQVLTTHYSFASTNIVTLPNPSRERIIAELEALAERLSADDHLLVFYAGHGYWNEAIQQGYWLPSNAQRASRTNWISNGELRDLIRAIKARHTLLISDACFSGGLFVTREVFTREAALAEVDRLPSRTAMTSGALTTVPDRSVFMEYLIDRLEKNAAPYLFAQDLFTQLRQPVINNSKRQADGSLPTPRYGVIQETNDQGGDFIFLRKTLPVVAAPLPAPTPSLDPAALEFALWQSADRSNECSEFEEYLRQYPGGRFAVSARNRKARVCTPVPVNATPVSNPAPSARMSVAGVPLVAMNFTTANVNAQGQKINERQAQCWGFTDALPGNVPLEMVEVEGGEFMMGSNDGDGDEKPIHRVRLKGFAMGKYEITQRQWRAVMGGLPEAMNDLSAAFKGDDLPVVRVSWEDVQGFLKKLGKGYRLPSEAEWEYAARAGTTTAFAFGPTISPAVVNYNGNYPHGQAVEGLYREHPVSAGSFPANAWGLFDMHGNVWEWCQDQWHDSYNNAPSDGRPWEDISVPGSNRVYRGGGWNGGAVYCRSANRIGARPASAAIASVSAL